MSAQKQITIAGGGLAGLTLGIGLRQRNVPVRIFEAGKYPRHRVCGEFISGRGEEILKRLGLSELLFGAGAIEARTARFFSKTNAAPLRSLPSPAICVSRFELDALLAKHFQQLGGDLREGERFRENGATENIIHATGRQVHPVENGWRWFGLKVHARGVDLDADLELHLVPNGYVGLCKLRGGLVNVCGLFRRRVATHEPQGSHPSHELLRGETGGLLRERLERAHFNENSFCAVAGLPLKPQRASASIECRIGDAITMIPPMTGNGMSMAIESADAAIEPLAAFSRGEISWTAAQEIIARRCDELFAMRLRWARWLQWLILSPAFQNVFVRTFGCSEKFWRTAFERTR